MAPQEMADARLAAVPDDLTVLRRFVWRKYGVQLLEIDSRFAPLWPTSIPRALSALCPADGGRVDVAYLPGASARTWL